MTFANLSQTLTKEGVTFDLQVSKNIHHQGETSFCWAFAISSMLRNSLLRCLICDVRKVRANNFHKGESVSIRIPYKLLESVNDNDKNF